jgi:hypothetical protein
MKRAILVLAAAAVVLVSTVWVVISAKRNQSDASGGTVELTERELRLPPMPGDSTAILLELNWDSSASTPDDEGSPDWLNVAKLAELGFDCHVPVTSPDARDHYSSMPPALVCLVLEYEGEAWKAASREGDAKTRPFPKTHLFAVDAGRDARRLREKYPDRARHIVTRGVVRPFLQERSRRDRTPLAQPRLRGWVSIVPNEIFVPQPHSKALQALRRRPDRAHEEGEGEPRFAVTVSWGARYEAWVQGVRLLPAADSGPKTR